MKILKENRVIISIFLLNILLASPLIIQSVPVGGHSTNIILSAFACLFFTINFKSFMTGFKKPSLPMVIFFLYLLSFFIGICVTGFGLTTFVAKEFLWGCFIFLILCCANIYSTRISLLKNLENVFSHLAVMVICVISLFSYLKYLIWKDDHVINFLMNNQPLELYPIGTALVGDVNFFSLTLLICSFLSFSLWRRSSAFSTNILWMFIFILLLVIGFLAGSKRFFLVSMIFMPILFLMIRKFDPNLIFRKASSILIACLIIFGIGYLTKSFTNISDYFRVLFELTPTKEPWFSFSFANTYSTLANANQSFGFAPRIERWSYGLDLINFQTIFFGEGFHYIDSYSCKFGNCSSLDYPHAPILSAVLYGGIFGLISFLILELFLIFISIKLLLFSKTYFEWGMVTLSTIIFTSISGNSLLSMPILGTVTVFSYAVYKVEFGESDYAIFKRLFDIIVSSLAILFLLPLFISIGLTIFLLAGRPIFFCQLRPGLNCVTFKMYKFRTMHNATEKSGDLLPDKDRLIAFGSFFRSTSLDEIPELWNVLAGDMSLVGPRPLLKEYLPLYSAYQLRRHEIRPGITGWAQINGRNSLNWDKKFNLDIWYLENMSFWLDIKILGITLIKVFKREGISAEGEVTAKPFEGNNKN